MDSKSVFGEMGVFLARFEQLSGRLATRKESESWWLRLGQLLKAASDAAARSDRAAQDVAMDEMAKLARRGAKEADQWRELLQYVKDLASLKHLQGQIEKNHKAYLSASEAMEVITTMAHAVKEALVLVLVRDQWRSMEQLLQDDDLLNELIERHVPPEDRGAVESFFAEWKAVLPTKEMNQSVRDADQLVQRKLTQLIETG